MVMKTITLWIIAFWTLPNIHRMTVTGDQESHKCKLDLGLVVDTTKSIGRRNVPFLRNFLKRLIQNVGVSQYGSHVSFETFAANSILHNKFDDPSSYSSAALSSLINKGVKKLTKPTRLDYALFKADKQMFTGEGGDRAGVSSVMVLFTDGRSHPTTTDYSNAVSSLKQKGVRIIVIAIGRLSQRERYRRVLRRIAGSSVLYAKDYSSLGSIIDDVLASICPPTPCESDGRFDVVFLLDRTESVGPKNYRLLRGFVLQIVDALDIGLDATRVAFILFARNAMVLNTLNDSKYQTNEAAHNLIANVSSYLGNRTFIDKALEAANDKLFTPEGGSRSNVPKVLILFTDGKTHSSSKPFEEIIPKLKDKNVHIAVVGIGKKIWPGQLRKIGDDVYLKDSFDDLADLFPQMLNETCSADGRFSRWSSWSECNVFCGEGVEIRTRNCTNPPPQGHGKDCLGAAEEIRSCYKPPCPNLEVDDANFLIRHMPGFKRSWRKTVNHK